MTFSVRRNEIFGLVGESGCGKSVTGMAILNIIPRGGEVTSGNIRLDGQDILKMKEKEMGEIRGRRAAMIFQDPSAALNPVFTVGSQTVRNIRHHLFLSADQARKRALDMYAAVSLPDPERIFQAYPHELSGGMQQRVMIAMALACGAQLLIADEPTTALDVTIQAQILALMTDLCKTQNISILLITHNLGVVAETCDRVGVAYAGRIVEIGESKDVLYHPRHPYTQGLLAALPKPTSHKSQLQSIPGSVPDGLTLLKGCPFAERCPAVMAICRTEMPELIALGGERGIHQAACYLYDREAAR
jgi:oligopeptide/dipeptide ABC transporter ATP-binding protein